MNMQECPYCGYDDPEIEQTVLPNAEYERAYQVGCPVCFMCGPALVSQNQAIEAWNSLKKFVPSADPLPLPGGGPMLVQLFFRGSA